MGLIWAAARSADLLEGVDALGRPLRWTRRTYGWAVRQVAGSIAVTARAPDGGLVMVGGVWIGEPDHLEVWTWAGPGLRRHLRPALRGCGGVLDAIQARRPDLPALAYVAPGGVAGARMARWSGFQAAGEEPSPIGPLQVFRRRA